MHYSFAGKEWKYESHQQQTIIFRVRWGKIRSIPYIPSFDVVQRERQEEHEAKMKEQRWEQN